MDPLKVLRIGSLVELEVINEVYNGEIFFTKIADVDENEDVMYIHLPMVKSKYILARKNDIIKVMVKMNDGIYSSRSKVIHRALNPYAHLKVTLPKKVIKEQRREFFRMPVNIMISYKEIGSKEVKAKNAVSVDLSGGGFCFISRNPIEAGKKLLLNFKLTNGKTFIDIKGLVKWNKEKIAEQFEHGIEFLDMENSQREELISYLFELQRSRRIID